MSFASETKRTDESGSEGLLRQGGAVRADSMNGSLSFSNRHLVLDVQTENAAIARRIYTLLKKQYDVSVELLVRKKCG